MKNTNILVEVEDDIYDLVVAPHKKNKTFSKVVRSLLTGYVEDKYIRAYVEGTLDNMRKASAEALDDILGSMNDSLASMGLYTDEIKSVNEEGARQFSEDYSYEGSNSEVNIQTDSSEISELKETVSELKAQNDEICNLLKQLLQGGSVAVLSTQQSNNVESDAINETPEITTDNDNSEVAISWVDYSSQDVKDEEAVNDNSLNIVEDDSQDEDITLDLGNEDFELEEMENDVTDISASNAMATLLMGNMYAF